MECEPIASAKVMQIEDNTKQNGNFLPYVVEILPGGVSKCRKESFCPQEKNKRFSTGKQKRVRSLVLLTLL